MSAGVPDWSEEAEGTHVCPASLQKALDSRPLRGSQLKERGGQAVSAGVPDWSEEAEGTHPTSPLRLSASYLRSTRPGCSSQYAGERRSAALCWSEGWHSQRCVGTTRFLRSLGCCRNGSPSSSSQTSWSAGELCIFAYVCCQAAVAP